MEKLLLHSCCAPCSSGVLDDLRKEYDITVFFYNPNIYPAEEYDKRANEQQKYLTQIGISYIICDYVPEEYVKEIKKPIKIAVMGCVVNGPGEAKEADLGLAGGNGKVVFFKKGQVYRTVESNDVLAEFLKEIEDIK